MKSILFNKELKAEKVRYFSEDFRKKRVRELEVNQAVSLNAPLGACVFKQEYQKIAFLIGGIGITPVISILEHIAEKKLNTEAYLVYSNRSEEEIAFKPELDRWCALSHNFKVSYIVTDCQPKEKTCIFGRIDVGLIKSLVCDLGERIVFIFGPPKMVEAMQGISLEAGAKKENLRIENFIGY